jgi:CheY-like chemotaxis protein
MEFLIMAKILIVEDDQDIAEVFQQVLQGARFEVDVAKDGADCLVMIRDGHYDLVLMDMFMPNMSGRETFEKILEDPKLKNQKVAFLTVAKISEKMQGQFTDMGLVDYIIKPISNKELIARVKKALKK